MAGQATPPAAAATATTPATDSKRPSPAKEARQIARLSNPTTLVTLIAGNSTDAKEFRVHKDFASHYSPVLKAAFNSSFIAGQTQIYNLPEADEDTVRLLFHWFYTQELLVDC
ncbi:hypothetical protein IFR05_016927 [Cadophora sp. M221]|nr:hypothetical protein IFR05_016927 [Cadophora sp. M221]